MLVVVNWIRMLVWKKTNVFEKVKPFISQFHVKNFLSICPGNQGIRYYGLPLECGTKFRFGNGKSGPLEVGGARMSLKNRAGRCKGEESDRGSD